MYALGQRAALIKLGLSRLDKEVARGNVTYRDVDPMVHPLISRSGKGKSLSRSNAFQGSALPQPELDRKRSLRKSVFNNQHLLADKAREIPKEVRTPKQQNMAQLFRGNANTEAHAARNGDVFVPESSGQNMRAISASNKRWYSSTPEEQAAMHKRYLENPFGDDPLPGRAPVDDTLNLATMAHEQGEQAAFRSAVPAPHATHQGLEPRIRENFHLMGDSEAQDVWKGTRSDPDNALVGKLMRQMGHHPDSPLPEGGRLHRSLEKALRGQSHKLDPQTLGSNFSAQRMAIADALKPHAGKALSQDDFGRLLKNAPMLTTIPHDARAAIHSMALNDHNARVMLPGMWNNISDKVRRLGDMYSANKVLKQYTKAL